MTQEQKARAYDEAIKRAKEFVCKDNVEIAEYIFPELAEDGDERIRKALVDLVKCNERSGYRLLNNVTTSSMLDWLEGQRDKDKLIKELGKYKVKYTQEVLGQYLEKQGRVKESTISRHEEDERIRKELITHFRNTRCVTEEGAERIKKRKA